MERNLFQEFASNENFHIERDVNTIIVRQNGEIIHLPEFYDLLECNYRSNTTL